MTEFKVTVTDLARFCHRSGDIDHRFTPAPTGPEGIAGHQRLYARRPESYQREYAVEHSLAIGGLQLTLRGRADGFDPQAARVEEIKTCRIPPDSIPPAVAELHRAQAMLYAALIAQDLSLPEILVRVTWLNIDSDEEFFQEEPKSAAELEQFMADTLDRFSTWLEQLGTLRDARDRSIAALAFPYGEFRPGQRDLAELAYKCIAASGQLMLEAPTGIGKTAAVLFPALKALATGKHERLAFVTARTVGRRTAEQTLEVFRARGYRGTAISLSAKESVCLSPGRACHGDDCPYARGYYDKLQDARIAALERSALARQDLEALAMEHEVCPYELASDLLPWIDTVICDIHYIYSLYGSLGNAMESDDQRWTVLLDEAHNLPGRARDMYSARLSKATLMQAKRTAPAPVARALEKVNRQLLALQKQGWQSTDYHCQKELPESLLGKLVEFCAEVSLVLGTDPILLQRDPVLGDTYFDSLHFLRVSQEWGDDFRCVLSRDERPQSLEVALNCIEPSRLLAERQARAHAVTAFSATLSPPDWMNTGVGLSEDTVYKRADSPFRRDQLNVWLATHIDTRYQHRQVSLPALADLLREWLAQNPGNSIVYFPSYRYMRDCLDLLDYESLARPVWVQESGETEERRAELLHLLENTRDIAAFCILGGIFGEGIDLPGEQLTSVAVVGVGMPQVNRETRELQQWYEAQSRPGFEYTFLYPGMQKVNQALGRVIRGPGDRGSALLIDARYAQARYRELLAPWWKYRSWPDSPHS